MANTCGRQNCDVPHECECDRSYDGRGIFTVLIVWAVFAALTLNVVVVVWLVSK